MAHTNSHYGRPQLIATFLLYLAFSVLLFERGLVGRLTTACIGTGADPLIYIWFLRWWRYALEHRINPFLTDLLWAPRGFNLAWSAFIPLPAWIAIPIGRWFGEAAAYNILCIVVLPLAALSAFLLCRRVTGAFWPAVLGGYIFGFSPYMLGHTLGGHLNLTLVFPIPLIAFVALRRLDGEISARRFTVDTAVLLVVQFLCGIELFTTMTLFAGFSLLVALIFSDAENRARTLKLVGPLAGAYTTAMIVLSPYLYYLFAGGLSHGPIWTASNFSADLLNFLIPTETNLFGTFGFARTITGNFGADINENVAYLGIPLVIVVEAYRRAAWSTSVGRFLTVMLALAILASFGPGLHVGGRAAFPMPWAITGRLPLISMALPVRYMVYAFLIVAVMVATWFASPMRPLTKWMAAGVILISIAPNPRASFWISSLDVPRFFTAGTYARKLDPHEIVLPFPFPQTGTSMYWQACSNMYFRMAGGWTTTSPFDFQQMPIVSLFHGQTGLPEPGINSKRTSRGLP